MKGSLFQNVPLELPEELFDTICSADHVKIERIVSREHASPRDSWYDQEKNEFVLIVRGRAGLRLEGEDEVVILGEGDYLNIAAHVRHRVEWTDATCDTIWLAVHY
jgi:cupin 2 domain-containing protein